MACPLHLKKRGHGRGMVVVKCAIETFGDEYVSLPMV